MYSSVQLHTACLQEKTSPQLLQSKWFQISSSDLPACDCGPAAAEHLTSKLAAGVYGVQHQIYKA